MLKVRWLTLIFITFSAALLRLLPHPYNFAPITAIALFGGAHFSNKRDAYLVTLGAMLLSDVFIGYHRLLFLIYGYFVLTVAIGIWLGKKRSTFAIAGATIFCSILFFVITNFAVWFFDGLYPPTVSGLMQCYAAAIPFFHNTVLGDIFYTSLLFGGFALAEKRFPILRVPTLTAQNNRF